MLIKYTGQKRFIFIANPKSASTSIEKSVIGRIADVKITRTRIGKHMSIDCVCERFNFIFEEFKFEQFFKFGVIRDPVDWVVSWFNYRSRPSLKQGNPQRYVGDLTFPEFWNFKKESEFLAPQSNRFFSKQNPTVKVDYLIRFSNLKEDLQAIEKILNINSLKLARFKQSSMKRINANKVDGTIGQDIVATYRKDYDLLDNISSFNKQSLDRFLS